PEAGVELPFYLMERVEGRALKSLADNADFTTAQLQRLSHDLAVVLAELHTIDPATVGLTDFGRAEGFLVRQVDRWGRQYAGSHNRELPELDALQQQLGASIPETRYTSIVHG